MTHLLLVLAEPQCIAYLGLGKAFSHTVNWFILPWEKIMDSYEKVTDTDEMIYERENLFLSSGINMNIIDTWEVF